MLDYLRIERFDSHNLGHRRLAELGREAHHRAAKEDNLAEIQREIDLLAAELRGLSQEELATIESYLEAVK